MLTSEQLAEFERAGFVVLPKIVPERSLRRLEDGLRR